MKIVASAGAEDVPAHLALIVRVFRTGLARSPEPAAQRNFLTMLCEGGGLAEIAAAVAGSREFQLLHGEEERCDEPYLGRLFRNAFGRDPDPGAAVLLRAADSRAHLLAMVADSDEGRERVDLLMDLFPDGPPPSDPLAYALWVQRYDSLRERDLLAISRQIDTLTRAPRISLLTIADMNRPDLMLETVDALDGQLYPDWDLVVACPHDLPMSVRRTLQAVAARAPAVTLVDAAPDAALGDLWRTALDRAEAPFVGFLEGGDRLAVTALYEVALALDDAPHLDVVYTDEDSLDEDGQRVSPLFKPGWSPDMLLSGDAIGQFVVMRRSRLLAVGGIRGDGGGYARYDLLMRMTRVLHGDAIAHIPSVLFHRGRKRGRPPPFPRSRNTAVHPDVVRTVRRHLRDASETLIVTDVHIGGGVWPRITHPRPDPSPRVSVLIPTRDQPELLQSCLAGLLERTDYPDIEVLIGDNGSTSAEMLQLLRRLSCDVRVRTQTIDIPFNWSALNNVLAARATGEVLVLMNDDVEVIGPDWLDEMVRQIMRPGVGVVGPRLLYRDGSLQHGGIVLQETGATHVLRSACREEPGYMAQLVMARDLSAVTGACLAIRRDVFEAVGGADESLPYTCNDIDLCLKVRALGRRVVWTPHAVLMHVDGASRGPDRSVRRLARSWYDLGRLHDRWPEAVDRDPFLNANLTATDHHLLLATPPRRHRPWHRV